MMDSGAPGVMPEHLFRRQAGRMVSHLARLLGPAHLSLAEEAVQDSMLRALSLWPYEGVPQNPEGWLFRVARNRRQRMTEAKAGELTAELMRSVSRAPGDPDVERASATMNCRSSSCAVIRQYRPIRASP